MPEEILRIQDLHKSFGRLEVLRGIDLTVTKGEVVVLIGRSGSGKSTLLRCINLLEVPNRGCIWFEGKEFSFAHEKRKPDSAQIRELRTRIGMVFQQFNLWPHLTVLGNITLGLERVLNVRRNEAKERAMLQLEHVGLQEKAAAYPGTLSGGQQQRVAIARALALQPEIMLFDEVTSALDPELVAGVLFEMKRLAQEGMTMIVVTHEMGFAREVGDRVVFIDQGVVEEDGEARRVITEPRGEQCRQFLKDIIH